MEGHALRLLALKELLLWGAAIAGGWLTFTFFEPFYDRMKAGAAWAGYARVFDHGRVPAGIPKFETRVSGPAVQLRGTIAGSENLPPSGYKTVTLIANDYGHFHADAEINSRKVDFMLDTGATFVALSYETAQALGLSPQNMRFSGRSTTANGVARVASISIDSIRIEGIVVKDVPAVVAEPGKMTQNLLGMSFIKQLSGFQVNGAALIMKE
jgi:aspartyl protease family protein